MGLTFRVEQVVRAGPERVFETLTDLSRAGEWMPGLVRIERPAGQPVAPTGRAGSAPLAGNGRGRHGPLAVGSTWRETRSFLGREATEEFEVIALEAPHRLDLRVDGSKGSSRRGEYLFAYDLVREGEGTRVRLDGEVRGLRGPGGLLARLLVVPYRRSYARDLRALARYLERSADSPARSR